MRLLSVTGFLLVALSLSAAAQCAVPKFHTGRDFSSETAASLFLSIDAHDFTIPKLTCLVQDLRKRHPGWKTAYVAIYGSREAAENYSLGAVEIPVSFALWDQWGSQYHASYSWDGDKKELFYISPFGDHVADFDFYWQLDLPLSGPPRCAVEMMRRCLMAVGERISYPKEAMKQGVLGKVTLMGVIDRNGSVSHLEVKGADIRPADFKELLTKAAIRNLQTWQFDSGEAETPFAIDYSYVMDTGPLASGQFSGNVSVHPNWPFNVEIRVKAPRSAPSDSSATQK
jgi:hypothetical protein